MGRHQQLHPWFALDGRIKKVQSAESSVELITLLGRRVVFLRGSRHAGIFGYIIHMWNLNARCAASTAPGILIYAGKASNGLSAGYSRVFEAILSLKPPQFKFFYWRVIFDSFYHTPVRMIELRGPHFGTQRCTFDRASGSHGPLLIWMVAAASASVWLSSHVVDAKRVRSFTSHLGETRRAHVRALDGIASRRIVVCLGEAERAGILV
ncbi:hypothetical protein [Castellaniella sp.]|uniref:hypothetical protein n=1 Tax=Castellaniella sp. TaxID=1955812 RepID=UPI0025C57A0D|nr:hypothetical protein [Castellaniella sp.]